MKMEQMKTSRILSLLVCALTLSCIIHAQEKEIIIIEKTIDENGNEVSKKIIRKNGEDISDKEIDELFEEEAPFGQWDIQSLGFGANPLGDWEELFNGGNPKSTKPTIGLSLSFENDRVTIVDVAPRSGAQEADIRTNDELIAIEGTPISSYDDIEVILQNKKSGEEIRVKVYRDGSEIDKIVRLKKNTMGNLSFEFPEGMQGNSFFFDLDGDGADFQIDSLFNFFKGGSMDSILRQLEGSGLRDGFLFGDNFNRINKSPNKSLFPSEDRPSLGIYIEDTAEGIEVSEVVDGSPAQQAGVQTGDIIKRFNDEVVTSFRELSMLMSRVKKGDEVQIDIIRNQQEEKLTAILD